MLAYSNKGGSFKMMLSLYNLFFLARKNTLYKYIVDAKRSY
jgi:hypothetical protein